MVKITTYYSNIYGMNITDIDVNCFKTRIAKWKDGNKYSLWLRTTPKSYLLDLERDFDTVEEAKQYYLETLKIIVEDTLVDLKKRQEDESKI